MGDCGCELDFLATQEGLIDCKLTQDHCLYPAEVLAREAAEKKLAYEERSHTLTINQLDSYDRTIQQVHLLLGGDGEWSSHHNLAGEIVEMAENVSDYDELALKLSEVTKERDAALADSVSIRRVLESIELDRVALMSENAVLVEARRELLEAMLDINEYWNGGNGSAPDACQHACDVSEALLTRHGGQNAKPE